MNTSVKKREARKKHQLRRGMRKPQTTLVLFVVCALVILGASVASASEFVDPVDPPTAIETLVKESPSADLNQIEKEKESQAFMQKGTLVGAVGVAAYATTGLLAWNQCLKKDGTREICLVSLAAALLIPPFVMSAMGIANQCRNSGSRKRDARGASRRCWYGSVCDALVYRLVSGDAFCEQLAADFYHRF